MAPGSVKGSAKKLERMAQVNDVRRLAGIELALQLLGLKTRGSQFFELHTAGG